MKKIVQFILLGIIFISTKVEAQKLLTEGSIQYKISISSSKSDKISNNLNGAELSIFLKPTISRSEMTSSLGVESTVYDNKLNKGFILREYSGQKLMITTTKANWAQKNQWNDQLKFEIDPAIVTIGGYSCKKAKATTTDGKTFDVYFTPDINVANKTYNNSFDQLPGLPVQYEIQSGNLTFKYSLSNVQFESVPAAKFETPKTGFRILTYEESQQLNKADK